LKPTPTPVGGSRRRFPIGAGIVDGQIDFRIWAPNHDRAELVLEYSQTQTIAMIGENDFFSAAVAHPRGGHRRIGLRARLT